MRLPARGAFRQGRTRSWVGLWVLLTLLWMGGMTSLNADVRKVVRAAPRDAVAVVPIGLERVPATVSAPPRAMLAGSYRPRFGAGAPFSDVVTPRLDFDPAREQPAIEYVPLAPRVPAKAPAPQPKRKFREPEKKSPPPEPRKRSRSHSSGPNVTGFLSRCHKLSRQGLRYQFGSEHPSSGGLDCSGAVQYLLTQEGVRGVPRTADQQFQWLDREGDLDKVRRWTSTSSVYLNLKPGDLLFWRGTYRSNRRSKITHVMIYAGFDRRTGKHMMFGASSRRSKGVNGNAVDFYEFKYPNPGGKGRFAGYGSIPGLKR